MEKEEFTEKRFLDLSRHAYEKNYPVFSDFLTPAEIEILLTLKQKLYGEYCLFGGYEDSERQMAVFFPDAFSMPEAEVKTIAFFPIRILRFRPVNSRFAEKLTHRDALGACMGLGIGREKIGDLILKESEVYIFAQEAISEYLRENLRQMRKTSVYGEYTQEFEVPPPERLEMEATVASNRLDAVLMAMLHLSRSKTQELIKSGYIFVNSVTAYNGVKALHPGDIISARGYGKFIFDEEQGETRKGRVKIRFRKYV